MQRSGASIYDQIRRQIGCLRMRFRRNMVQAANKKKLTRNRIFACVEKEGILSRHIAPRVRLNRRLRWRIAPPPRRRGNLLSASRRANGSSFENATNRIDFTGSDRL